MTMAVCFNCGVIKFGAFVPCPECHGVPQTEDELVLALAMTDHYFDQPTLEQMGAAVRDGHPPHLAPPTRAMLLEALHSNPSILKMLTGLLQAQDAEASLGESQVPTKKPWWKFW